MASKNCSFSDIRTENLGFCPNEDTVGGIKIEAYYIPMAQLSTFTRPVVTDASTYEERVTIASGGIVVSQGKSFKKIILMADENELKNNLVGNKGNKKNQVSFDAYIPNLTAANIGFVDTHKNTPMLFIVRDSTGRKWVLADAFIDKADGTSGKKYEDNSGISISLIANSKAYTYAGDLEVTPDV